MISLKEYRIYCEELAFAIDEIDAVLPITIDKEMTRCINNLSKDKICLFWLPPAAKDDSSNPDSDREENSCILFVMQKYDPQRCSSIDCLERTQPIVEELKRRLKNDSLSPCQRLGSEISALDTLPETDFYGTLAGWSIGFKIKTDNLWPTD